ncbi:dTDP-4-amino-4,6-dideoxygalactose transaminase [Cytophaga hutchinsonii]|jgi:dTDP-4-amino-4,6-dideoxygalactose transaminase|uniref:Lipopolysaccharide biosynthesis protein n=1 Tax=Cytophaga hutchinsonii (strain ATCC 33406 / DSM 1761 / CIP 103989 / NBRC 15051 / NCIMB 9469 / D465) TaxID=269798 RepID=A0A6N4SVG4_CYTH3|nr:dTDP-4-amino-4,6-dideoxygalactose transaminase [Cytophaga hutchinsonii]ABG60241.1 lipopolysaccharide biosynthesis protein [Cytophaga hutchinsonii ATCC 33406]SFX21018.1 dTDP-4-amino-4,6-dideoxygalactose transaminase [Cytophaga hutchinsonii ATCC 33406]
MIPFNKPHLTGKEVHYIYEAVHSGKISGNGIFTKKCHDFFTSTYGFTKTLMTSSCTDALEMSSLLMDIQPGDEIILPTFTFVSTANAFVLRGAKLVFVDSLATEPNMNVELIEGLITSKTKAIVVVHYAGVACDMDVVMNIAKKYQLFVVEDAAQAISSYYKDKPLGGIGDFGAFSFHETKNIISGEGGLLAINNSDYCNRSEIIWEKGTNRSAFFRGETDKYGWVDVGSSFLPSEIISAFLYAQLENVAEIQAKRLEIWNTYYNTLSPLAEHKKLRLPYIPAYATNNAHMFYVICNSLEERTALIDYLKAHNILAVFHYLSLHKSPYFSDKHDGRSMDYADQYAETLVRLPLFYDLSTEDQEFICTKILSFYSEKI